MNHFVNRGFNQCRFCSFYVHAVVGQPDLLSVSKKPCTQTRILNYLVFRKAILQMLKHTNLRSTFIHKVLISTFGLNTDLTLGLCFCSLFLISYFAVYELHFGISADKEPLPRGSFLST